MVIFKRSLLCLYVCLFVCLVVGCRGIDENVVDEQQHNNDENDFSPPPPVGEEEEEEEEEQNYIKHFPFLPYISNELIANATEIMKTNKENFGEVDQEMIEAFDRMSRGMSQVSNAFKMIMSNMTVQDSVDFARNVFLPKESVNSVYSNTFTHLGNVKFNDSCVLRLYLKDMENYSTIIQVKANPSLRRVYVSISHQALDSYDTNNDSFLTKWVMMSNSLKKLTLDIPEQCILNPFVVEHGLCGYLEGPSSLLDSTHYNREMRIVLPSSLLISKYVEEKLLPPQILPTLLKHNVTRRQKFSSWLADRISKAAQIAEDAAVEYKLKNEKAPDTPETETETQLIEKKSALLAAQEAKAITVTQEALKIAEQPNFTPVDIPTLTQQQFCILSGFTITQCAHIKHKIPINGGFIEQKELLIGAEGVLPGGVGATDLIIMPYNFGIEELKGWGEDDEEGEEE